MADESLEGRVEPTLRELRWFRRKQTEEVRTQLEKLKELVMEKGSRTLIRYLMSSTERTLEEIAKTNKDLISQLNEKESVLETEWFMRMEAEIFSQVKEAHEHLMERKDEPPSEAMSQKLPSILSTLSSRIEARKSAERAKLELESLQRKKEIELQREKEKNKLEEEKLRLQHEQEQRKQSIEQEERELIMQTEAQLAVEEARTKHFTAQMELEVEEQIEAQASRTGERNEVVAPSILQATFQEKDKTRHEQSPIPARETKPNDDVLVKLAEAILKSRDPHIKKFDGSPSKYTAFRATFKKLEQEKHYTQDELLDLLLTHITGKAETALRGILPGSGKYDKAWDILKVRFGDSTQIMQTYDDELRKFAVVSEKNVEQLRSLSETISSLVSVFESLGKEAELKSSYHVREAVRKLPPSLKLAWARYEGEDSKRVTLDNFRSWLEKQARMWEHAFVDPLQEKNQRDTKPTFRRSNYRADVHPIERRPCPFHEKAHHPLEQCRMFKSLSTKDKEKIIRDKGLCLNCLGKHIRRQCRERLKCGVDNCQQNHHHLLHGVGVFPRGPERAPPEEKPPERKLLDTEVKSGQEKNSRDVPEIENRSSNGVASRRVAVGQQRIVHQIVPVVLYGPKVKKKTMAMLDSGSNATLIHQDLAHQLGFSGQTQQLLLSGTNTDEMVDSFLIRNLTISGTGRRRNKYTIDKVLTVPQMNNPTYAVDWAAETRFDHLKDLDLQNVDAADVQLVIGVDSYFLQAPLETREGPRGTPVAIRTRLGWIAFATLPSEDGTDVYVRRIEAEPTADYGTNKDFQWELEQWINMEAVPSSRKKTEIRSFEDQKALDILHATTRRLPSGDAFESGILWRDPDVVLPNNRKAAEAQLYALERRLDRDPELKEAYRVSIINDVEKGYIKKLDKREVQATASSRVNYLTHHPLRNPKKPGTVRRVYNAAAKYDGKCWNDFIYTGPDLLNPLFGVLLRFRQGRIALCSDIKDMFLQMRVVEEDLPALRFLYRYSKEEEPSVYQCLRRPFGERSAPTCANYIMRQNAEDFQQQYPAAAEAVRKNLYVDDSLNSLDDEREAITLRRDLTELMKRGGFTLTKWLSNSQAVMKEIPESDRVQAMEVGLGNLPVSQTLGVRYNAQTDTLHLSAPKKLPRPAKTPREILSRLASIWDPHGWLSPFTIRGRILQQQLFSEELGWDAEIPEDRLKEWRKWEKEIETVENVTIPRCLRSSDDNFSEVQLHVFSDSSKQAKCAASYLRFSYPDGKVYCSLVAARSRVAPKKRMTIPRLELDAACMAVKLALTLVQELDYRVDLITFWIDSMVALHWIHQPSNKYRDYVAHRIVDIGEDLKVLEEAGKRRVQVKYVPTKMNVADAGTRGLKLAEATSESTWQSGPEFLYQTQDFWPQRPDEGELIDEEQELRKKVHTRSTTAMESKPVVFNLSQYSSFEKAKRVVANVLKFIALMRNGLSSRKERSTESFKTDELHRAEMVLLRQAQRESFQRELETLTDSKPIPKNSRLVKLSPFIEESDGLLRVEGRIQDAPIAYDARHPIIVDGKSEIGRLIINDYHHRLSHGPTDYILSSIRTRFWLVNGRSQIKKYANDCLYCKKRRVNPKPPRMGNLPARRLTPFLPPFTHTIVDLFGPIYIKQRRNELKRWCVLFCCANVRAVHVEVAESLETDAFLNCLTRFANRRGYPRTITSDRGTNFVGAEREMREGWERLARNRLEQNLTKHGTDWVFHPPNAPHMNGAVERLVKSCKRALHAILRNRRVDSDVLHTALVEVEGIINSRPITPASSDPLDLEALTPNHILIYRPNLNSPFDVVEEREINSRKKYRQAQVLANMFWNRWLKEYLPLLTKRNKWTEEVRNIEKDDLVMIVEPNVSRGMWQTGRVLQTFPGKDGRVRSAKIKTNSGIYVRPVARLCLLEENDGKIKFENSTTQ